MIATRNATPWLRFSRWLLADPDRVVGIAAAIVGVGLIALEIWERMP